MKDCVSALLKRRKPRRDQVYVSKLIIIIKIRNQESKKIWNGERKQLNKKECKRENAESKRERKEVINK